MGLKRRLEKLEDGVEESAAEWKTPPEALVVMKMYARTTALREGREPPPYTPEELEELHQQDLEVAEGRDVVAQLEEGIGWQDEAAQRTLEFWREDARKRLDALAGGETLEAVYERHDLEDEQEEELWLEE